MFQKVYDEIKYLCKVATAGSKEARQLEKVKKTFEQIYRESTPTEKNTTVKYSMSKEIDNLADNLSYGEWKRVNEAVSEYKNLNYHYEKSSNGDIIIPVNNKLVYTDTNLESVGISKIIEINSEFEDEIDHVRSMIYEAEEGESKIEDAYSYVEAIYGAEIINEYTPKDSGANEKYDRRAERGKSKSDSFHANFLQERIRRAKEIFNSVNNENVEEVSSNDDAFFDEKNKYSLSKSNEQPTTYGNYNVMGEDVMLEAGQEAKSNDNSNDIAPVRQDVVKNDTTEDIAPVRQDITKDSSTEDIAPVKNTSNVNEDIAPLPENSQVNLFVDKGNLPPQNVHTSVVTDSGKWVSRAEFDIKANANQLVGRIEYLTSKGNIKEVVEYANKERFIEDVKDNEYNGVPTSVLFYANEDGTTIDRKFANDLNPVTTNGKVIQNPYMKMPSSSANLDNLAPPNKKYKKKTTEIPTAKQAMKKPIDAPINKKVSFNKTEIDNNVKAVAEMQSVCDVSADKLKRTGKKPSEIFSDYFNKWGNNIRSKVFGDISLKNSSIKSEIRHGITAEKIASIEAIPDVIENGKVIFAEKKENSDVERIVVSAPIKIGEDDYLMGVMLQRDSQNQRLYLHNVVIAKETSNISEADLLTTGADKKNEHLFMSNILQNVLNVKNTVNSQSNPDKNSNNKLYLHEAEIIETDSSVVTAPQLSVDTVNESVSTDIIPSQNNFVNKVRSVKTIRDELLTKIKNAKTENIQPVENNTNVIGDIVQKYSTEERYKNILC